MKNSRVLAIIPARGGSKGLIKKNVIDLCGLPLIAWTIKSAQKSRFIDKIILTSDDTEIMEVAERYGCEVPFKRPKHLSGDKAETVDVIYHAIQDFQDYDYLIILQPTSPLRTEVHIDEALQTMIEARSESCVSVCHTLKTPFWMYEMDDNQRLKKLLPTPTGSHNRQTVPQIYELNGAIYITKIDAFMSNKNFITADTVAYVMTRQLSVDIDTQEDLDICEHYLKGLNE